MYTNYECVLYQCHILINQDRYSSKFCSKKRLLIKILQKIHVKVYEGNRSVLYSWTFNSSRQNPLDYLLSRENHKKTVSVGW